MTRSFTRWLAVLGLSLALLAGAGSAVARPLMDATECRLPGQLLRLETELGESCRGAATTYRGELREAEVPPTSSGSSAWIVWTGASALLLLAGSGLGVALFRIRARAASSEGLDDGLDRLALG